MRHLLLILLITRTTLSGARTLSLDTTGTTTAIGRGQSKVDVLLRLL